MVVIEKDWMIGVKELTNVIKVPVKDLETMIRQLGEDRPEGVHTTVYSGEYGNDFYLSADTVGILYDRGELTEEELTAFDKYLGGFPQYKTFCSLARLYSKTQKTMGEVKVIKGLYDLGKDISSHLDGYVQNITEDIKYNK